jgi:hypothetical protein
MVTKQHRDYAKWLPRWQRCRDAAGGEDAVKERGEVYLPRPSGQKDKDYLAYKKRAYWYNATQRTIDGLTGLIFRKEPQVEAPESMKEWLEDVTLTGISLREFASHVVDNVMQVGRAGILVDYPTVDLTPDLTVAQLEGIGARPYLALYQAEDIINWRFARVGSKTQLVLVVLRETADVVADNDEFELSEIEQYRVLDLEPNTAKYRQRVFRKDDEKGDWKSIAETYPLIKGQPFTEIPFVFVGVGRNDGQLETPPVYDLANINLSHYRTLADLENGAHWTGLPTPVFSGLSEDKKEVALGSTEGVVLPIGGEAKYLEFTGQGLQVLENRAKAKEEEMAVLGARILATEKRQPETAETAAIHRAGENSVLASIANTASRGIDRALEIAREWGGLTGDINIQLNTDYLAVQMNPAMLTSLTAALQAGKIGHEDYFWYLQRGDVIREERTFEEMMADIEANPPIPLSTPAAGGELTS